MDLPVRARDSHVDWPRTVAHVATEDLSDELGRVGGGDLDAVATFCGVLDPFLKRHGTNFGDLHAETWCLDPDFDPIAMGMDANTTSSYVYDLSYIACLGWEEDEFGELAPMRLFPIDVDNSFPRPGSTSYRRNLRDAFLSMIRNFPSDTSPTRILGFSLNELADGHHSLYVHFVERECEDLVCGQPRSPHLGTPLTRAILRYRLDQDLLDDTMGSVQLNEAEASAIDPRGYRRWRVLHAPVEALPDEDIPLWQEVRREMGLHDDFERACAEVAEALSDRPDRCETAAGRGPRR